MIKTTSMLLEQLNEYASPKSKLQRMVKHGECFPIARGLYETDPNTPAYLLAGSIYGPSYISFAFALSYYALIPETVHVVTSATFEKKKKKKYQTSFGIFSYRDVPSEAFPLGLRVVQEGNYYYRIAEPEKALCDQLYTISPVPNQKELLRLLTEDLRIETSSIKNLDKEKIASYSNAYHSTNVQRLNALLRRF